MGALALLDLAWGVACDEGEATWTGGEEGQGEPMDVLCPADKLRPGDLFLECSRHPSTTEEAVEGWHAELVQAGLLIEEGDVIRLPKLAQYMAKRFVDRHRKRSRDGRATKPGKAPPSRDQGGASPPGRATRSRDVEGGRGGAGAGESPIGLSCSPPPPPAAETRGAPPAGAPAQPPGGASGAPGSSVPVPEIPAGTVCPVCGYDGDVSPCVVDHREQRCVHGQIVAQGIRARFGCSEGHEVDLAPIAVPCAQCLAEAPRSASA